MSDEEEFAPGPGRFPWLCSAGWGVPSHDRTAGGRLPDGWWTMSEDELIRWFEEKHEAKRMEAEGNG